MAKVGIGHIMVKGHTVTMPLRTIIMDTVPAPLPVALLLERQ
jgi:hypothetical protein